MNESLRNVLSYRKLGLVLRWVVGAIVVITSIIVHKKLGLDLANAIYETARLFLLEANTELLNDNLHTHPTWLYSALWFVRVVAPIVTIAHVFEVLLRLGVFGIVPFHWRDHIIVCGAGRIGSEFVYALRQHRHRVVVIDITPDHPEFEAIRRAGAKVIVGDASHKDVLIQAKVHRAERLIAATPDDILNLNTATTAYELSGDQKIKCLCHVYDASFHKYFPKLGTLPYLKTFNAYDVVAQKTAQELDLEQGDRVVIAGFGRFGRSFLRSLFKEYDSTLSYRVIDNGIDVDKVRKTLEHKEPRHLEFIAQNITDAELWNQAQQDYEGSKPAVETKHKQVVIICTDNDTSNLACALALIHEEYAEGVHVRLFKPIDLIDQLTREKQLNIRPIVVWKCMIDGLINDATYRDFKKILSASQSASVVSDGNSEHA